MKKINVFYAIIAIGIIIAASAYGTITLENGRTPYRNNMTPHFHLKTDFPVFEPEMRNIYKIVPNEFNPSRFEAIGDKFGLEGKPKFIDENHSPVTYVLTGNEGEVLEYHMQTSVWIYIDPNEAYHGSSNESNLPSDSEAQQIAEAFLKENGFWSENITFSNIRYTVQGIGKKGTDETISEWVIAKKIYFDRQLDELKLRGVGAKSTVTVVEGGKVASFIQPTRKFQAIGNASLISPEKAFEKLQQGIGIRCKDRVYYANRDIDIENIYLCYYVDSLLQDTGPIIPCYAFEGKFCDNGNEFRTFVDAVNI